MSPLTCVSQDSSHPLLISSLAGVQTARISNYACEIKCHFHGKNRQQHSDTTAPRREGRLDKSIFIGLVLSLIIRKATQRRLLNSTATFWSKKKYQRVKEGLILTVQGITLNYNWIFFNDTNQLLRIENVCKYYSSSYLGCYFIKYLGNTHTETSLKNAYIYKRPLYGKIYKIPLLYRFHWQS